MVISRKIIRPTSILFDWDGTLANTYQALYLSMNDTLINFGHEPKVYNDWLDWFIKSPKDSFKEIFKNEYDKAYKYYLNRYSFIHNNNIYFYDNIVSILDHLYSNSDITLGIVSNKKKEILDLEIRKLFAEKYFSVVVGSGDTSEDKPSPKPILHALSSLNKIPSKEVWFIGDTEVDVKSGLQAGCTTILINNSFFKTKPDILLENHSDLLDLVFSYTS